MWKLSADENNKRVYTNSATNSICEQSMCYTDKDGNKWWEFDNLAPLPFTRNFASIKISSLYALGISIEDANSYFTKHKATLKTKDNGEKYEIAYAETLDFENKFKNATDAVKQISSLVCVYFTMNDEPIDSFDQNLQGKKMSLLEADTDMHNFFLKRRIDVIELYMNFLNSISQIASVPTEELPEVLV